MNDLEDKAPQRADSDPVRLSYRRSPSLEGIFWVMLLVGIIPFVGLLIEGSWSQVELGVAVPAIIGAVVGIIAERRQRHRDKRRHLHWDQPRSR